MTLLPVETPVSRLALPNKLELKAVNDGSASYAALERKAELYDKLVRGELPDEEENEKYYVDIFRKGAEQSELEQPQNQEMSTPGSQAEDGEDDNSVLPGPRIVVPGRTAGTADRNEHKRFVIKDTSSNNVLHAQKIDEDKLFRPLSQNLPISDLQPQLLLQISLLLLQKWSNR